MTDRNDKARDELKQKLAEQKKPTPEQIKKDKQFKVDLNNHRISCIVREKEYKQSQLANGITETRVIEQSPGQPAVAVDGYVDGLKPRYVVENEIAALKFNQKKAEQELRDIEEMGEKNKD